MTTSDKLSMEFQALQQTFSPAMKTSDQLTSSLFVLQHMANLLKLRKALVSEAKANLHWGHRLFLQQLQAQFFNESIFVLVSHLQSFQCLFDLVSHAALTTAPCTKMSRFLALVSFLKPY